MRALLRSPNWLTIALVALSGLALMLGIVSCGGGGTGWASIFPFPSVNDNTSGTTGPGNTGTVTGSQQSGGSRAATDPCNEAVSRKFITISMRNYAMDYVHYFFVAIAFIDVDQTDATVDIPSFDYNLYPDGAVCEDDIGLYTDFGYTLVEAGSFKEFGDYCITGPALLYFHDNGNFRVSAGTSDSGLGSGIAPIQGSMPSFDNFFTSAGARIPVPDLILFHNPGAGSGADLKISTPIPSPCSLIVVAGDTQCNRDAFYYVASDDIMLGSRTLGVGSGRRVPSDIQGTGCECLGVAEAFQALAPSGVRASGANCNEFLRGGRIDYAFFEDDTTPAFPQLVWQVKDASNSIVHEFSPLSPIAGD